MAERGTIYPVLPGNCPDAGYKLVSKNGFVDAPLSSENLEWAKDEAITDADKQQIITNKNDIADIKEDITSIETEIADKSEVSGENDGTNWTKITIDGVEKNIPSGGSGFTPTQAQLDAMNSGIDSTKVGQIQTNADDISSLQTEVDNLDDDKQDKLTPGDGIVINGTDIDVAVGDGIELATQGGANKVVKAKVDGTTIHTNASGELEVIGGGGGSTTIKGKALHDIVVRSGGRGVIKFSYISNSASPDFTGYNNTTTGELLDITAIEDKLKVLLNASDSEKRITLWNTDGILQFDNPDDTSNSIVAMPVNVQAISATSIQVNVRSLDMTLSFPATFTQIFTESSSVPTRLRVNETVTNINGGEFELLLADLVYEGTTTGSSGVLYFSNYLPLPSSYRNALINFTISYEEGVTKSNDRIMAGVLDESTKYTRWLESGGELGLVINNKGKFCLQTTGTVKKNDVTISSSNLKYQWDNTNKQLKVTDNNDVLLFTYNISSLKVRWD